MTYFLEKELNVTDLHARFGSGPVYHIDVVAAVGGAEDSFQWTTNKLSQVSHQTKALLLSALPLIYPPGTCGPTRTQMGFGPALY